MTEHPNLTFLKKGYEAFNAADIETVAGLYHPEVVWHCPGNSLISGDHKGLNAVLEFFGKLAMLTDGTFKVEVHDLLANDDHGVCLSVNTARRGGKDLNLLETHVYHIKDGKITEAWNFPFDADKQDEFWS